MTRAATSRVAGQHVRDSARAYQLRWVILLGLLIADTFLGLALHAHSPEFELFEFAGACMCLVIVRVVVPEFQRRERGAIAEEQVGSILDGLAPDGWHATHDVIIGRGNVDHVLVGPAGVFTIETKSTPRPVQVRRLHGALVAQAHAQRRAIEAITHTRVEPLLVFTRAPVDRPCTVRKGVRVIPADMLSGYLARRRCALDAGRVHELQRRLTAGLEDERQ